MPQKDLRDRLDGNELDLSMDSLAVVPIKELAALPRATHVDLSCNLLQTLPDQFCTLTHLVKLDLSKNHLTSLPLELGSLQRLQYLDLFENKLVTLPVSMYKLKNLKYLDLKTNPLSTALMKVAGDCLDDTQCKSCAKRVIQFLRDVNAEQERRRQKELQEQRAEEAAARAEEDRARQEEKERIKAAKLALKEKRRQEYLAKQAETQQHSHKKTETKEVHETNNVDVKPVAKSSRSGLSCFWLLLSLLVVMAAVLFGLVYVCQQNTGVPQCQQTLVYYKQARTSAISLYTSASREADRYLTIARRELHVAADILRQKFS